jgi:hypothetical protein
LGNKSPVIHAKNQFAYVLSMNSVDHSLLSIDFFLNIAEVFISLPVKACSYYKAI